MPSKSKIVYIHLKNALINPPFKDLIEIAPLDSLRLEYFNQEKINLNIQSIISNLLTLELNFNLFRSETILMAEGFEFLRLNKLRLRFDTFKELSLG